MPTAYMISVQLFAMLKAENDKCM